MKLLLPALAVLLLSACEPAFARDNGQYANVDPLIRQWYATRQLTPAAQARLGYVGCCDHSDKFVTQFRVNQKDGGDEWWYLLRNNTWKQVPADIIHWDEHGPEGEAVLFVMPDGTETCFFPPGGGM